MNRFEKNFLNKLADFCGEAGYIITEDGYIEKLEDWVDPSKPFSFEVEETEDGIKYKGVNQ